jgi:WD40 repeat protein
LKAKRGGIGYLWDANSGKELRRLHGEKSGFSSLAFSPDGKKLATGMGTGEWLVWNVDNGEEAFSLKTPQPEARSASRTMYSADGAVIVGGGTSRAVIAWDGKNGDIVRTFDVGTFVAALDLTPNGRLLLTGSSDGTLKLWELATGRLLVTLLCLNHGKDWLAFSPDGHFEGSEGGRRFVSFCLSDSLSVAMNRKLTEGFYRPGLVSQVLASTRPK